MDGRLIRATANEARPALLRPWRDSRVRAREAAGFLPGSPTRPRSRWALGRSLELKTSIECGLAMAGTKGTTPKWRMGMICADGMAPCGLSLRSATHYCREAGDGAIRRCRLVGEKQMVRCDRTGYLPIGVGRVERIAVELRRFGYGLAAATGQRPGRPRSFVPETEAEWRIAWPEFAVSRRSALSAGELRRAPAAPAQRSARREPVEFGFAIDAGIELKRRKGSHAAAFPVIYSMLPER